MSTPAITFATDTSRDYKTVEELVLNLRGIGTTAQKPVVDVVAIVHIGGQYVELLVPNNVYSRTYKDERRWRTPTDVGAREQAWRGELALRLRTLAERL